MYFIQQYIFLILSLLGLTQDDNYSPSASSSSRPSHQGVKRKYKSNNGDNVKTSYPKKEPKIEPEISLEHPDEHAIGQDEDIGEDYGDYGDYEVGPSGKVGSDGTPRCRKYLTLDQKIEIIACFDAGMKTSTIARERRMAESSVRAIIKRQDQIKELVGRSSYLSPNTVVRKNLL